MYGFHYCGCVMIESKSNILDIETEMSYAIELVVNTFDKPDKHEVCKGITIETYLNDGGQMHRTMSFSTFMEMEKLWL